MVNKPPQNHGEDQTRRNSLSSHTPTSKVDAALVYRRHRGRAQLPNARFYFTSIKSGTFYLKRLFCLVGEGTESGGLGWSRRYNVEETGLVLRSHGISGFADQGSVIRLGTGNEGGHRSSGALRHQNVRGLEEKHLVGVHGTEIWL